MISPEERIKLLNVLGTRHVSKVLEYFSEHKIYNRDARPYSNQFVSRVFNGHLSNKNVEDGIYSAVEDLTLKLEAEKKQREDVLTNAKNALDELPA